MQIIIFKKKKLFFIEFSSSAGNEGDFAEMMQKRKEKNSKKYRRRNVDSEALTDADQMISNMITEMKAAAAVIFIDLLRVLRK